MHVGVLRLIYSLLLAHTRYFFGTDESVLRILNSVLSLFNAAVDDKAELSTFTYALEALDSLNDKQNLFQRLLFITYHRSNYLFSLFASLFGKAHELLRDEIIRTIYNIVAVDFAPFHSHVLTSDSSSRISHCSQVLPVLLDKFTPSLPQAIKLQLIGSFDRSADAPTFAQSVLTLVNDACYFNARQTNRGQASLG